MADRALWQRMVMAMGACSALLSLTACETLRPSISPGDTLSTKYGPASVELIQRSSGGPIYRLVFASCHPDMAAGAFDPAADAGVKAPPSLQKRWIWSCKG